MGSLRKTTTVIIGAGHAGLAMSKCLSDLGVDHIVLERGQVANSWCTERWDSLRLLTPNWQSRLPGYSYKGGDPNGYRSMSEVIQFINDYASFISAPVQSNTNVLKVRPTEYGFQLLTSQGEWECKTLVIASGACNIPNVPKIAENLEPKLETFTPFQYRNPDQLPQGGVVVVGASATGVQLASEIHLSGRPVTLSVGEHVRVPRFYRGRDIKWWMDASGLLDESYDEIDDLRRARRVPSLQLTGCKNPIILDLNHLSSIGIKLVGRVAGINESSLQISGSLKNVTKLADLKMDRLLDSIDEWTEKNCLNGEIDNPERFKPTQVDESPPLAIDIRSGEVKSIIWATGFRPDLSWLDVPVLNHKGEIRHNGGIVEHPGMYLLGMQFLRKRKSSLIDGAGEDARFLSKHLRAYLDGSLTG